MDGLLMMGMLKNAPLGFDKYEGNKKIRVDVIENFM